MNITEWMYAASAAEFLVIDTETYFWAERTKFDMPDLPDGRKYQQAQDELESTRGKNVKFRSDLGELRAHVDQFDGYCFAVGLGGPGVDTLIWSELDGHLSRETFGEFVREVVSLAPVVFHNASFDLRILLKNFGVEFDMYKRVDDSMLLHNVLWSELPHSLNFCSSIYSSLNRHKDLGTHSLDYLEADVTTTGEVWMGLKAEADRDPQSWNVYESLQRPLLPIILEAHVTGILLDQGFMATYQETLAGQRDRAQAIANEFVEGEINMNSPKQMNEWIYGKCGLKIKGLKPGKSGLMPLGKDELAQLQDQFVPREKEDTMESRISDGSHPLVEAKVGFTQADKFLTGFITPYLHETRIFPQFKLHGQATGRWSTNQPNVPGMNESIKPMMRPDEGECWIGGDWSNAELRIMAELSDDQALKKGFAEGWDLHSMHTSQAFQWDSPKGRFAWAKQFRKVEGSWDDYTTVGEVRRGQGWWGRVLPTEWKNVEVPESFDWHDWIVEGGPAPGWKADKDPLRRFCKVLVFRLLYGGSPRSAGAIPGAQNMGLPLARLIQASNDLLIAHPCWESYWDVVGAQAKRDRVVRNHMGRARKLLALKEATRFRAGVNFPIQSSVSDLLNRTLILVKQQAPYLRLVYTIHDSFYFACPLDKREEATYIISKAAIKPLMPGFHIPFDLDIITMENGVKCTTKKDD